MSIGKKIAGFFVETDDEPVAAPTVAQSSAAPVASPSVGMDSNMVATLQRVVAARKTPYTALLEAADKLKSVIPDDATRLKAAFAMISSEGQRTLDGVLQAIDIHITDVDGEGMRFKQASDSNAVAKVGALRSRVASITATRDGTLQTIANLEKEIAAQRTSIAANEQEIIQFTTQANDAEREIAILNTQFKAAIDFLKADLTNKKTQLSSVLA